ncbi:MAG: hypothetical protein JSW59_14415, partial [Phycisphaerales bacterium]
MKIKYTSHSILALLLIVVSLVHMAEASALNPNDFTSLGAFPSGSFAIDTTALTYNGSIGGVIQSQGGSPEIAVFTFDGDSILDSADTITVTGSRPLALLFQGDAVIRGKIDVSGVDGPDGKVADGGWPIRTYGGSGGPGGGSGGDSAKWGAPWNATDGEGPGGGGGGGSAASITGTGGGGGGGFGGKGANGQGSYGSTGDGAGGPSYGNLSLALEGGSGGGGGGFRATSGGTRGPAAGGGGGGGIEIGALSDLDFIGGLIDAKGGNGGNGIGTGCGGGGGSGGAIFLHAFNILLDEDTVLGAQGGDEGDGFRHGGCGGGGRILVLVNDNGDFYDLGATINVDSGNPCVDVEYDGVFTSATDPDIGIGDNQAP